ncbi:hypothetical protein [Burkholderia stabilis]
MIHSRDALTGACIGDAAGHHADASQPSILVVLSTSDFLTDNEPARQISTAVWGAGFPGFPEEVSRIGNSAAERLCLSALIKNIKIWIGASSLAILSGNFEMKGGVTFNRFL